MKKDEKKRLTVFVSGHLDLTVAEFEEHYVPELYKQYCAGSLFVVGDAAGCDLMTQQWLFNMENVDVRSHFIAFGNDLQCVRGRYRVYHMLSSPRNNYGREFQRHRADNLVGGFATDEERDAAMTKASDLDIAWVRPGKRGRSSGTAKNLLRRSEHLLNLRRLERATWPRAKIIDDHDCNFGYGPYAMSSTPVTADVELDPRDTTIPVPPDFHARYNAACAAYCEAKRELDELVHEAENLGDIKR